jgi:hypothetical protein
MWKIAHWIIFLGKPWVFRIYASLPQGIYIIYIYGIYNIYIYNPYIYITHIYITYCTTLDSAQHRAGTVATDPTAPCRPDGTVGLGPSHQVFALPWLFQFVAHHLADRDQIWKHENLPWHIF